MIRWCRISSIKSISGRNSFKLNVISDYDDMRMYGEFHSCPVDFQLNFLIARYPWKSYEGISRKDFPSGFCGTLI